VAGASATPTLRRRAAPAGGAGPEGTALALREYPDLNGYWIDDAFQPGEGIHLGVAINLRRGGLLAPAIRDADERSLDELMAALRDLVGSAPARRAPKGSELTDPTITVSNLGDTGVETIQGVITPPQVALVGVGRITERPWAVDGLLAVRRTLYLSLAGDHRASDGHLGGRFLAAIAAHLDDRRRCEHRRLTRTDHRGASGTSRPTSTPRASTRPLIDLRDELDLDSMDELNLITTGQRAARHRHPGVADYPQMRTLDGAVDYLASATPTGWWRRQPRAVDPWGSTWNRWAGLASRPARPG
jgi:hypothetical protein